ncbi:hypothetical protein [Anoxybacteroides tepidamans]|uniref:hypothetical protein n=1 Tax=Anoxybacteroides tepidamans TaxID=265948 RepID=UPI00048294AE|nr:hypothetical protein [Anoxybacillus tepidamans]
MKKAIAALSLGLAVWIGAQTAAEAKVYWNGSELKPGQIGRLTVLKTTELYQLQGEKKIVKRTLKPGEKFRIYTFKPGMLGLGGGYYIDRDNRVKYETPSKAKLNQVKIEQLFRGAKMGMTPSQIKKIETGKLVAHSNAQGVDLLIYSTSIFGYNTEIWYGFEKGKLTYFGYDFDPEVTYTEDQLLKMYNNLKQQLISIFGNSYQQSDSEEGYPPALTFEKNGFTITLSYDSSGLWIDIK